MVVIVLLPFLAGAGVGDIGVVHEPLVGRPVEEAVPAAAFRLSTGEGEKAA